MVSPIAKADNRFGRKLGDNRYFSKSLRWSGKESEVGAPQYLLKPMRSERESAFGTSTREDWGRIMGLIPRTNPNAGEPQRSRATGNQTCLMCGLLLFIAPAQALAPTGS